MFTFGKTRSEEQQALSRNRAERARKEQEDVQRQKAAQMVRQRAQRLAREAAEKENDG